MGTSTFVMASIDEDGDKINTLNLGDSGFLLLRPDLTEESGFKLIFRSKEQQYKFNHPYQCGTNYKPPYHADTFAHFVQHNDILVLATDGVLDNLYDPMIISCIQPEINLAKLDLQVP